MVWSSLRFCVSSDRAVCISSCLVERLAIEVTCCWRVICTADFNGGYDLDTGVYGNIKPWLDDHHLDNLPHTYLRHHPDERFDLSSRGSVSLDHITSYLPGFTYRPYKSLSLQQIDTISDHKPIFADFVGPSLNNKSAYRPPQHSHVDLDLHNKSDVETFQAILSSESAPAPPTGWATDTEHASYIDSLCDFSVRTAESLKSPKKLGHHCFQGWSPQYMLDCYYLSFLHKLKGLVAQHDRMHLHPSTYTTDVLSLTAALLSKVDYLNRKTTTLRLHDLTV